MTRLPCASSLVSPPARWLTNGNFSLYTSQSYYSDHGNALPTSDNISPESEVEQTFVWGTNVNIEDSQARFRRFIENFEMNDRGMNTPLYPALMREILSNGETHLNLDCLNLHEFDEELYHQLVSYPQEIIPIFDLVLNDMKYSIMGVDSAVEELPQLQVHPFNLKESKPMRDLNPSDIDQLVSIQGMVTRTSTIIPDLKTAFFQCHACHHR